jgi:hypothetical protein
MMDRLKLTNSLQRVTDGYEYLRQRAGDTQQRVSHVGRQAVQVGREAHQGLVTATGGTLAKVAEGTIGVCVLADLTGYGESFNRIFVQILFIGFLLITLTAVNTGRLFFNPPPARVIRREGESDQVVQRGAGILPININDVRAFVNPYQVGLQQGIQQAREGVDGINAGFERVQQAIGQAQRGVDYVNKNPLLKITLIVTIGTLSILILAGIGNAFFQLSRDFVEKIIFLRVERLSLSLRSCC